MTILKSMEKEILRRVRDVQKRIMAYEEKLVNVKTIDQGISILRSIQLERARHEAEMDLLTTYYSTFVYKEEVNKGKK